MQSNEAPDYLSKYSQCQYFAEYPVATLRGQYSVKYTLAITSCVLVEAYAVDYTVNTLCRDTTLWSTPYI